MGIDIGGTFTDFAIVDERTGATTLHKLLTTPADPSLAVLEGIGRLLDAAGVRIEDLGAIVHGSTLVTNAVIERRGASTGMLVTRGFADVLDIALERRYDLYDLRLRFPAPIVPRACRREIDERMRDDGTPVRVPDLGQVDAAIEGLLRDHQVEAIAVCFLHSFTNPTHEAAVVAHVRERFPQIHVSGSADVLPVMREYERWTTTTLNAYVQPVVDRYLARVEQGLAAMDFRGSFHVMTSSAGTVSAALARRYPVRMLESGPAAGVYMAAHHGRTLGIRDLLSFDMGGTTAKGAIVRGGRLHKQYRLEVARVHEFKAGSGLPTCVPVVDMIEIGAGGGGIAEVDDRGVIRVGPRSAGAVPGPACYGLGGADPTLTDANLTLGYLDPRYFLGGTMALDAQASREAIDRALRGPLGIDTVRAAWGIHETINEDIARAFRAHASDIGFDYRRASMVAFGGSGPAHAARVARKLRIPRVVFPAGSGVMSAIGMLVSPISYQSARTRRTRLDAIDAEAFASGFAEVEADALSVLAAAGIDPWQIGIERHLDMRYAGQGYEVEVHLPAFDGLAAAAAVYAQLPALFSAAYAHVFSLSFLDEPVEIMNWKVDASAPVPAFDDRWSLHRAARRSGDATGQSALKGKRQAFFPEADGFLVCPVYDRYSLVPGARVDGPALVEERESTCVLGVGDTAVVDGFGNLVAEVAGAAGYCEDLTASGTGTSSALAEAAGA